MQFIYNGSFFKETDALFGKVNRAFQYGDFISEFVKISNLEPLLLEEHYFNLMASMRIFRMKIPQEFTQEFFSEQINQLCEANGLDNARIKISVYRNADRNSNLVSSTVSYLVEVDEVYALSSYSWRNDGALIDVYKDYAVNDSFFSQVCSHKPEELIAQAYMQENELQDLVLLNQAKKIARTIIGSPFLVVGETIKTPPLSSGGIRSVTRSYFCELIEKSKDFILEETEVYPFELQKADELLICIESTGIMSITQNRKKRYETETTAKLYGLLNAHERS